MSPFRHTDSEFELAHDADATPTRGGGLAGKYLTFSIQQQSYGITALKVREIIRFTTVTIVPQVPEFIRGVINLRGKIIPIMDLRVRMGLSAGNEEQTCIVVVRGRLTHDKTVYTGVVVDGVEEVVTITSPEIEPTPEFGSAGPASLILGMAKVKGRITSLLNMDQILFQDAERLGGLSIG